MSKQQQHSLLAWLYLALSNLHASPRRVREGGGGDKEWQVAFAPGNTAEEIPLGSWPEIQTEIDKIATIVRFDCCCYRSARSLINL